jgi:hypothetical protein
MPRALSSYGVADETSSFVLEDPAFVDAAIARIVEDIQLVTYVYSLVAGKREIDAESVYRVYDLIIASPDAPVLLASPEGVREWSHRLVRDLSKAPLPYGEEAVERVGDLVGALVYDIFRSGAESAAEEGSRRIGTRHFLPACERWPYPLNRFC